MKALWWDDISGRRQLEAFLGGIGWGLLIGSGIAMSSVLAAAALVPLILALIVNRHIRAEARRT